ncbi:MAG: VanZ family protein [Oscillospiraceae bacterium]|nr:VanZ family protein [Oscillospiraceae bacterium]
MGKIHHWIYAKTGAFDNILFSLPVVLAVMIIYWFVRCALHRHRFGAEYKEIRRRSLINEIIRLFLVGWLVGIVCVTLTPSAFWDIIWRRMIDGESIGSEIWRFSFEKPNLIPCLAYYIDEGHLEWLFHSKSVIVDLAVNVALFVPLGLALPFLCKKASLLKTAIFGFACSFLIELIQCFIVNRDSNIDDLLCNTSGTVIGYLLYLLIKRLFAGFTEKGKTSANDLWKDHTDRA